jgi:hypothetical protein
MKSAHSLTAACIAILLACGGVFGSWAVSPLSERVAGADLIVVGKLSDVVKRDFSLTYANKEGNSGPYTTHYDVGMILEAKVLKGELGGSGYARVAFASDGQDGHPFNHMLISHSSGEAGIWLLTKDRVLTGYYFVHDPQNPLPLDSEPEVARALQAAEKK